MDKKLNQIVILRHSLLKIPQLHLVSRCGNFVERHIFCAFPQNVDTSKLGEITVFSAVISVTTGRYILPCLNFTYHLFKLAIWLETCEQIRLIISNRFLSVLTVYQLFVNDKANLTKESQSLRYIHLRPFRDNHYSPWKTRKIFIGHPVLRVHWHCACAIMEANAIVNANIP